MLPLVASFPLRRPSSGIRQIQKSNTKNAKSVCGIFFLWSVISKLRHTTHTIGHNPKTFDDVTKRKKVSSHGDDKKNKAKCLDRIFCGSFAFWLGAHLIQRSSRRTGREKPEASTGCANPQRNIHRDPRFSKQTTFGV